MSSGFEIMGGAICGLIAAAVLALGMVLQRYAFVAKYGETTVPVLCCVLGRNCCWVCGLLLYGVAQAFYSAGLLMAPLSLLGSVFTLLLVFNMIFARYFLKEPLTPPRVASALVILLGVTLCAVGTPDNTETKYSPQEIEHLFKRAGGSVYYALLGTVVIASVVAIVLFERRYSSEDSLESQQAGTAGNDVPSSSELEGSSASETGTGYGQGVDLEGNAVPAHHQKQAEGRLAPVHLEWLFSVIYPGCLGIDEGLAQLNLKGVLGMFNKCVDGDANCDYWTFFFMLGVWVVTSLATLWWMRICFKRYEVTQALPIEYGAVNVAAVCSGLIFYNEVEDMSGWQLALVIVGCVTTVTGIAIGRLSSLPCFPATVVAEDSPPPSSTGARGDNFDGSVLAVVSSERPAEAVRSA